MRFLFLVAVSGMGTAWALYPAANGYSIMTCTISFLGSPDARHNPEGWRFYQAGMTAAILLLGILAWRRQGRKKGRPGWLVAATTAAYSLALGLMLLSVWIPDSRELLWGERRSGEIHTRVAVAAVALIIAAVVLDGITLALARSGVKTLAPFAAFAAVAATGIASLISWKRQCEADPALRTWPGDGIHSTPMWEWILFVCLCLFLAGQARR